MKDLNENRRIKGKPLWTTSPGVSGGEELLKTSDFPREVKDRYDKENLNEEGKNV